MGTNVLFLLLLSFRIEITLAAYDLELKLIHYHRDKDCCDSAWQGCSDCDVYFKVCLSGARCQGGVTTEKIDNANDITFSEHPLLRSTFSFELPNWKNSVFLTIQAFDNEPAGADSSIGSVTYNYTGPPVNISLARATPGPKNLSITFSLTTKCVPDGNFMCNSQGIMICKMEYFGRNCDIHCKATDHKVCNSEGKLQCIPTYYGPDCSTHCSPASKHQLCLLNGTKQCKPTYYGPTCTKHCEESENAFCDNDGHQRCKQGLNKENAFLCINGNCKRSSNGTYCACSPGYSGKNCEFDIDECSSSPCFNGSCKDIVNGFACFCNPGFTGKLCDYDVDECLSSPCFYGSCVNEINGYSCNCDSGFSGTNRDQSMNDCINSSRVNVNCSDGFNIDKYLCNPEFTDHFCDTIVNECPNFSYVNSTCSEEMDNFVCVYIEGRTSSFSRDYNFSSVSLHYTNASYKDDQGDSKCLCGVESHGKSCEIESIGANCTEDSKEHICACDMNCTNSACNTTIDECFGLLCFNDTFENDTNILMCACNHGCSSVNNTAEIDECFHTCLNGSCVDIVNGSVCVCDAGYTGTSCDSDIDECLSSPCLYGSCVNQINKYSCVCDEGYFGDNCELSTDECQSLPCVNGYCVEDMNGYICQCYEGYTGHVCDIDIILLTKVLRSSSSTYSIKVTSTQSLTSTEDSSYDINTQKLQISDYSQIHPSWLTTAVDKVDFQSDALMNDKTNMLALKPAVTSNVLNTKIAIDVWNTKTLSDVWSTKIVDKIAPATNQMSEIVTKQITSEPGTIILKATSTIAASEIQESIQTFQTKFITRQSTFLEGSTIQMDRVTPQIYPGSVITSSLSIVGDVQKNIPQIANKIKELVEQSSLLKSRGKIKIELNSTEVSTRSGGVRVTTVVYTVSCTKCYLQEGTVLSAAKAILKSMGLKLYSKPATNKDDIDPLVVIGCIAAVITTCMTVLFLIKKREIIILRVSQCRRRLLEMYRDVNGLNLKIVQEEENDLNIAYDDIIVIDESDTIDIDSSHV